MSTTTLPKRQRPVRDAIGAVASTIGTTASIVTGLAELADLAVSDFREDMKLDNYENETERLIRRKELEAQRAELLGA